MRSPAPWRTVGTNKKEAKADVIKNTTEDNKTDLSYNVYVVEETGWSPSPSATTR
mgnify:CR=1 FL=1